MRTFSPGLISKLLSETASVYVLLELELNPDTLYYTNMDIPFQYSGNRYRFEERGLVQLCQILAKKKTTWPERTLYWILGKYDSLVHSNTYIYVSF